MVPNCAPESLVQFPAMENPQLHVYGSAVCLGAGFPGSLAAWSLVGAFSAMLSCYLRTIPISFPRYGRDLPCVGKASTWCRWYRSRPFRRPTHAVRDPEKGGRHRPPIYRVTSRGRRAAEKRMMPAGPRLKWRTPARQPPRGDEPDREQGNESGDRPRGRRLRYPPQLLARSPRNCDPAGHFRQILHLHDCLLFPSAILGAEANRKIRRCHSPRAQLRRTAFGFAATILVEDCADVRADASARKSIGAFGWRTLGVTLGPHRSFGRRAKRLGFA